MYISHLLLVATLISGYGACNAFHTTPLYSKSHLSVRGSTTELYASTNDQNILIVGGGVAGLSIAHYLKKNVSNNNLKVTLLEKEVSVNCRDRGSASVNSYCTITPKFGANKSSKTLNKIIDEGQSMYSDWISEIAYDGDVETQGVVVPFSTLTEFDKEKFGDRKISVDEIRKIEPLLNENIEEWVYFEEGVKYNAQILLNSLRAACEKKGVVMNIGEKWDVECLTFDDDGDCRGVKLADGDELLGTVVVANGNSCKTLMKDKSGKDFDIVSITALEAQVLTMKPKKSVSLNTRVVGADSFVLQNPDGTIFVGDSGQFELPDNIASVDACLAEAATLVPVVADWDVEESYVAIRAVTNDEKPILGEITNCNNLYVAGGLGSCGTTTVPKCAQLLGSLILDGMDGLDDADRRLLDACSPTREDQDNKPDRATRMF